MTKYIIGTISDLDVPLNPYAKGELSLGAWFAGITEEELQELLYLLEESGAEAAETAETEGAE